ncbi:sugar dehydrogenase complex small subunit [Robbsia sp. KACC 23696]|uniref:sugar dehydrogenase complex small subunit n=1 Tax=Robbsia sp. KACC 23696 TaxID=3149231 RepID=UPI00325ACB19
MSARHRSVSGEAGADSPSRRQALKTMASAFAQIGLYSVGAESALAYATPAPGAGAAMVADTPEAGSIGAIDATRFLALSAILTNRETLNARAAARMLDAFNEQDAAFSGRAGALFRLARSQRSAAPANSDTAQWLLGVATPAGLHDTALQIVPASTRPCLIRHTRR